MVFEVKEADQLVTDKVDSNSIEPKEKIETEKPEALNLSSVISKEELRRQKRREYMREYNKKYYQEKFREHRKKYYQNNKEKFIEYNRKYRRERYHSNSEYREKQKESGRKRQSRYQEEYKRFKIEYGRKCSVCGVSDLDVLVVHHPDGRQENSEKTFWQTKEFRKWLRYGIKPNVVLVCANHHFKIHSQST